MTIWYFQSYISIALFNVTENVYINIMDNYKFIKVKFFHSHHIIICIYIQLKANNLIDKYSRSNELIFYKKKKQNFQSMFANI